MDSSLNKTLYCAIPLFISSSHLNIWGTRALNTPLFKYSNQYLDTIQHWKGKTSKVLSLEYIKQSSHLFSMTIVSFEKDIWKRVYQVWSLYTLCYLSYILLFSVSQQCTFQFILHRRNFFAFSNLFKIGFEKEGGKKPRQFSNTVHIRGLFSQRLEQTHVVGESIQSSALPSYAMPETPR